MNDAIDWLRSPQGEAWSRWRIANARDGGSSPTNFQPNGSTYRGFFSLKPDFLENAAWESDMYSGAMLWGTLLGDEKLEKEYEDARARGHAE